ncbi:hypothetical protein LCGC14_1136650 [marine sediment metagenome]|uniref:Uncharacterized protein n=2 Tax=marine sediment metagenome TaxID=412755 RepID=A0A0F9LZM5_9ZZZZ
MPSIEELGLNPEQLEPGQVDYDAPESGSIPPQVPVGTHEFLFNGLEDDPYSIQTVQGKNYLQVAYRVQCLDNNKELRFQRVSTYKSEKMSNSLLGELFRALGIKVENLEPSTVNEALLGVAGRGTFTADVVWRGYNKGTEESFSTSPNTKKGEQRVTRNGSGQFDERVNWADGTTTYLSAEINPFRFKLPTVAVAS